MYESAWDNITKYHRLCGLSNIFLFSHSSGGGKFKIKMMADLFPGKGSLLGWPPSHHVLTRLGERELTSGLSSSFYKDINPIMGALSSWSYLNLIPKGPTSVISLGVRA